MGRQVLRQKFIITNQDRYIAIQNIVSPPNKITLTLRCDKAPAAYLHDIRIVVPVISASTEKVQAAGNNKITIQKNKARVTIGSDQPLTRLPTTGDRFFNFVPGLEAIPLTISRPIGTIDITVRDI